MTFDESGAHLEFVANPVIARCPICADTLNVARLECVSCGTRLEGSFALGRFFNGLSDTASSSAKNTTWRGGGRAEVTLSDRVVAFAGYQKDHRDLEGSALINTLYLQTLTFGGIDPRDLRAFGGAVVRLLSDAAVASAMGQAAQERVRTHFLGSRHLRQYLDLLTHLLHE